MNNKLLPIIEDSNNQEEYLCPICGEKLPTFIKKKEDALENNKCLNCYTPIDWSPIINKEG